MTYCIVRTCIGPNFSKLGVRNDTSVSLTTRPSVSTKPLGQANLMLTTPETDENPIPVICAAREALKEVGVLWYHHGIHDIIFSTVPKENTEFLIASG